MLEHKENYLEQPSAYSSTFLPPEYSDFFYHQGGFKQKSSSKHYEMTQSILLPQNTIVSFCFMRKSSLCLQQSVTMRNHI